MDTLVIVFATLVGLATGSFLNVVIHRVPAGLSVAEPGLGLPGLRHADGPHGTTCPSCPGWCCGAGAGRAARRSRPGTPPSRRPPASCSPSPPSVSGRAGRLPAELAFVGGLIALAAVDLERFLLPRAIVYPTLALVAAGSPSAAAVTGEWRRLGVAGALRRRRPWCLLRSAHCSPRLDGLRRRPVGRPARSGPRLGRARGTWSSDSSPPTSSARAVGLGLMAAGEAVGAPPCPTGCSSAPGRCWPSWSRNR